MAIKDFIKLMLKNWRIAWLFPIMIILILIAHFATIIGAFFEGLSESIEDVTEKVAKFWKKRFRE